MLMNDKRMAELKQKVKKERGIANARMRKKYEKLKETDAGADKEVVVEEDAEFMIDDDEEDGDDFEEKAQEPVYKGVKVLFYFSFHFHLFFFYKIVNFFLRYFSAAARTPNYLKW